MIWKEYPIKSNKNYYPNDYNKHYDKNYPRNYSKSSHSSNNSLKKYNSYDNFMIINIIDIKMEIIIIDIII